MSHASIFIWQVWDSMHLSSFGMRPFVLDATLRLPAVCEELAECATCHMCRGVSSFRRSSIGTKGRSTSCTFCEALHMSPAKPSTTHKSSKLMLPSDMASKHLLPAATSDADDVALLAGRERRCGWFAALVVVVDPQRPLASVCACMGCSGIAPVPLLMVSVQEACLHA